MERLKTLSGLK